MHALDSKESIVIVKFRGVLRTSLLKEVMLYHIKLLSKQGLDRAVDLSRANGTRAESPRTMKTCNKSSPCQCYKFNYTIW